MHAHGQGAAGGREDGGLGRGQHRCQDGDDDQPAPGAQHHVLHGEEDVVLVGLVAQPDPVRAHRGVHHHQEGHGDVDYDEDKRRNDGAAAGGGGGVLGLLVHREAGVPAPVDEQCQQGTMHHRAGIGEGAGGVEPLKIEGLTGCGRAGNSARDPEDNRHGEDAQREVLHVGQDPLDMFPEAYAAVVHQGHEHDEQHAGGGDHQAVPGQGTVADQQPQVLPGDLGEVGQDHDAGQGNAPPAQPAGPWTEGPAGPDEGGPAVRHGAVELTEGEGDEEHGHEAQQQDQWSVIAVDRHDQAQGRRERIDRRGGGQPQHHGVSEVQDPGPQSLGGNCRGGPGAAGRRRLGAHRAIPALLEWAWFEVGTGGAGASIVLGTKRQK